MRNLCSDGCHLLLSYKLPGGGGCQDLCGAARAGEGIWEELPQQIPARSCWQPAVLPGWQRAAGAQSRAANCQSAGRDSGENGVLYSFDFLQKSLLLLQLIRAELGRK